MTALPRRSYGDPLEKILAEEEESCKGCRWRVTEAQFTSAQCRHPKKYGEAKARCADYEERNA